MRPGAPGSRACCGAATLFKPPFLILVPLALLAREWRRIAAFGAGIAAGLLLPALRYGWQGNLELLVAWRQILDATTPPLLCGPQNQSAFAVACTYLVEPAAGRSFQLAALAVGGVVAAPMLLSSLAIARRDRTAGFRAGLESALYLSAFRLGQALGEFIELVVHVSPFVLVVGSSFQLWSRKWRVIVRVRSLTGSRGGRRWR